MWQARLMALRALRGFCLQDAEVGLPELKLGPDFTFACHQEVLLEQRLLEFFRHECGHGHAILRHVAEIVRESSSNQSDIQDFRASTVSTVAVSSLGFTVISELLPSLSSSPPHFFAASVPILNLRSQWAEKYLAKFPHRKLSWCSWGAARILWRHSFGQTMLTTTELQAHLLLAVDGTGQQGRGVQRRDFEEAALAWSDAKLEPWLQVLSQLTELREGPLEEVEGWIRARCGCELAQLDLTSVPTFSPDGPKQAGDLHNYACHAC